MSYQGDHFYIRCATILVKTVSEMMSWLNFLNGIQVSFDSFQITAEVKRNLICGTLLACQGTLIDDRLSEMAHLVSSFLFVRHPHFAQLFVVIYKPLLLFVRQIACNANTHTLISEPSFSNRTSKKAKSPTNPSLFETVCLYTFAPRSIGRDNAKACMVVHSHLLHTTTVQQ